MDTKIQSVESIVKMIQNPEAKIGDQYRGIFQLKSLSSTESVKALLQVFKFMDNSELLMHQITYAIGQLSAEFQDIIFPFLIKVVEDENEFPVVRHEAGEGLANFACLEHQQLFQKYAKSDVTELRNTCLLALKQVQSFEQLQEKYGNQYYGTREPAAPFSEGELEEIFRLNQLDSSDKIQEEKIEALLFDQNIELFDQYRLMYYLRDSNNPKSCEIYSKILNQSNRDKTNNLLRHEVCFILGQLADQAISCMAQVQETILDEEENEIVRHQAISAYSSMTEEIAFLQPLIKDKSRIVKESAIVALDMIDYWKT